MSKTAEKMLSFSNEATMIATGKVDAPANPASASAPALDPVVLLLQEIKGICEARVAYHEVAETYHNSCQLKDLRGWFLRNFGGGATVLETTLAEENMRRMVVNISFILKESYQLVKQFLENAQLEEAYVALKALIITMDGLSIRSTPHSKRETVFVDKILAKLKPYVSEEVTEIFVKEFINLGPGQINDPTNIQANFAYIDKMGSLQMEPFFNDRCAQLRSKKYDTYLGALKTDAWQSEKKRNEEAINKALSEIFAVLPNAKPQATTAAGILVERIMFLKKFI